MDGALQRYFPGLRVTAVATPSRAVTDRKNDIVAIVVCRVETLGAEYAGVVESTVSIRESAIKPTHHRERGKEQFVYRHR